MLFPTTPTLHHIVIDSPNKMKSQDHPKNLITISLPLKVTIGPHIPSLSHKPSSPLSLSLYSLTHIITFPHSFFSKKKKEKNTHIHTLFSFTQTHSKKQHPDLKCNNNNSLFSLSLSLSLFSQKCHPNNSHSKNPNPIQKPQSKTQDLLPFQPT